MGDLGINKVLQYRLAINHSAVVISVFLQWRSSAMHLAPNEMGALDTSPR